MRASFVVGIAVGFGSMLVLAQACSSNDTSPSADAGTDALVFDGPVTGDETPVQCSGGSGDVACFSPSSVVAVPTTSVVPTADQGACASDDLVSQFFVACVANADAGAPIVDAGDGGDGAAPLDPCDAFIAANSDCAQCLGGFGAPDGGVVPTSPWPALIAIDPAGDVAPAVANCVAAISSGSDTCKQNYASDDLCARSGCSACDSTDNAGCLTAEMTNPFSTCACTSPVDATCSAAIGAVPQATAAAACGASTTIASNADLEAVFMKVGRTLCESGNGDL
jgi:hypothetical protein